MQRRQHGPRHGYRLVLPTEAGRLDASGKSLIRHCFDPVRTRATSPSSITANRIIAGGLGTPCL